MVEVVRRYFMVVIEVIGMVSRWWWVWWTSTMNECMRPAAWNGGKLEDSTPAMTQRSLSHTNLKPQYPSTLSIVLIILVDILIILRSILLFLVLLYSLGSCGGSAISAGTGTGSSHHHHHSMILLCYCSSSSSFLLLDFLVSVSSYEEARRIGASSASYLLPPHTAHHPSSLMTHDIILL